MASKESADLWQVLHNILGIRSPGGNCMNWTRMAYYIFTFITNYKVMPMGTLVEIGSYSMTHWYLKGICPINNRVEVEGKRLKELLECESIKQWVKHIPSLDGIVLYGGIVGSSGGEIVLDGTAHQFREKEKNEERGWGFYGPAHLAKKRLRDGYEIGKEVVQIASEFDSP